MHFTCIAIWKIAFENNLLTIYRILPIQNQKLLFNSFKIIHSTLHIGFVIFTLHRTLQNKVFWLFANTSSPVISRKKIYCNRNNYFSNFFIKMKRFKNEKGWMLCSETWCRFVFFTWLFYFVALRRASLDVLWSMWVLAKFCQNESGFTI